MAAAFLFRGFVASSDAASSWFSPFYNAGQLLHSWSTYNALGTYGAQQFTSFFLRIYYSAFELISPEPNFIQKFAWFSFFSAWGLFIMYLLNKYFNNIWYAFATTIFLYFNPATLLFLWGKQHWSYYLVVPYFLGILLYREFLKNFNLKYAFYTSVLWFIFGFVFNQPAYFASFLIILFTLAAFNFTRSTDKSRWIKSHFAFVGIFFLINFVYIVPLASGGVEKLDFAINNHTGGERLAIFTELADINFAYSFLNISKVPDEVFISYAFLIYWLVFIVIFFSYLYKAKKVFSPDIREQFISVALLFLIFVFLVKGISEPFSKISTDLFSIKYLYIFRDFKDKFAIGYALVTVFAYILILRYANKYIKYYLFSLAVACYLLFTFNLWLPNSFKSSDSLSYLSSINIDNNESTRMLSLPLVDHSFLYNKEPFYTGDNPLKNILNIDVLFGTDFKSNNLTNKLKSDISSTLLTEEELNNYLSSYAIEYVLSHKRTFSPQENNESYDPYFLQNFTNLSKVQETENYILYKVNDTNSVIQSTGNTTFTKISNTLYIIKIENLYHNFEINFLSNFHKKWDLLLVPNTFVDFDCPNDGSIYNLDKTKYCEIRHSDFLLNRLLFDKEFANENHYRDSSTNTNVWTASTRIISRDYQTNYYSINDDGSMNITLVLYFRPQNTFILSLCVSLLSLIFIALIVSRKKL